MRYKEYQLLDSLYSEALDRMVSKRLQEGWLLYGEPSISVTGHDKVYSQAVVLPAKEEAIESKNSVIAPPYYLLDTIFLVITPNGTHYKGKITSLPTPGKEWSMKVTTVFRGSLSFNYDPPETVSLDKVIESRIIRHDKQAFECEFTTIYGKCRLVKEVTSGGQEHRGSARSFHQEVSKEGVYSGNAGKKQDIKNGQAPGIYTLRENDLIHKVKISHLPRILERFFADVLTEDTTDHYTYQYTLDMGVVTKISADSNLCNPDAISVTCYAENREFGLHN
jgi:hypothetical protein